jgi:hypothetical protein
MTWNWIATVSRTLQMDRTGSTVARRRSRTPRLENLEHRLSLSSVTAGGGAGPDIIFVVGAPRVAALRSTLFGAVSDLNPQPLPPSPRPEVFLGHGGCHN